VGDGDGGRGVPFVLAARVDVRVHLAEQHGRDLGPGGADRYQLHVGVDVVGEPLDELRRAGAAHRDADAVGVDPRQRDRLGGGERPALAGQRDGARPKATGRTLLTLPEGDVHGPVAAPLLGVLPGAVERVDDPHALGVEAGEFVLALLAENGVPGTLPRERLHQVDVGLAVAGVAQGFDVTEAAVGAQSQQERARLGREVTGEGMVVVRHELLSTSVGAGAAEDRGPGLPKNLQIESEGPVLDVTQIQADRFLPR
jgi:hypothetical protein